MTANVQHSQQPSGIAPRSGTAIPALFRAGDIGVAAEWRDLSYDWTPLLTPLGVSMYEQCRDTYDQQRALYPFLLSPQGPTKHAMQRKLGLRTGYALQGPEHLLATVGLLHVEVDSYGPSTDPERPNHTRVAYYVVGRLDHPTLDWTMLSRILTALLPALDDPSSAQHKKAEAALRSLAQAGFLQLCDPEDLFYPLGAWPYLLPTLIGDPRWTALFTHVHGAAAAAQYREQVRAWVEYAQRLARRLQVENDAIRDQVIAAQRRGGRGGSAAPASAVFHAGDDQGLPPAPDQPVGAVCRAGSDKAATDSQIPATPVPQKPTEPVALIEGGPVAALSLPCRCPGGVSEGGPATAAMRQPWHTVEHASVGVAALSLPTDQLIQSQCRCGERETYLPSTAAEQHPGDTAIPAIVPHLRDAELTSTRYDATFWCEVNTILRGVAGRYDHSAGEKKAAERRFKQQAIPTGVVLAALRAVMELPEPKRPRRFGDALTMEVFHGCVQQALALLPARCLPDEDQQGWPAFLHAYRSVALSGALRNVSTTDYHVLRGLFQSQPAECWDVLNRVERAASPPNLSPAYLRRAIANNLQAAAHQALTPSDRATVCRPAQIRAQQPSGTTLPAAGAADPRLLLLEQAGLSARLLQPWMTVEYIQAWLDEAAARPNLENARGWLIWGLGERCLPHEHPRLPPRPALTSSRSIPAGGAGHGVAVPPAMAPLSVRTDTSLSEGDIQHGAEASGDAAYANHDLEQLWRTTLSALARQLPAGEFETWLRSSELLEIREQQAVIGVPHIFAREKVATLYADIIEGQLQQQLGVSLGVQIVIA